MTAQKPDGLADHIAGLAPGKRLLDVARSARPAEEIQDGQDRGSRGHLRPECQVLEDEPPRAPVGQQIGSAE